jgi:hypothetical protein
VKITEAESRKENYSGWRRWAYKVESEDVMKNYWNKSCSKVIIPNTSNFEPACISPARQEMVSPTSYQSSNCKNNTSEIFILSLYAKQNNLLPSINHLNQLVLKLYEETEITIV